MGSMVTLSACVLIGLRAGREVPDWRLTGRLAVSELAVPDRVASTLKGSAVKVPGTRYFADGNGLAVAEATEATELS